MKKGPKKIKQKTAVGIINVANWRDKNLARIDADIDRLETALAHLKERRNEFYRGYNDRQLSLKFKVTATTVHRIVKGHCWKELDR